jgi:hypothetical protein
LMPALLAACLRITKNEMKTELVRSPPATETRRHHHQPSLASRRCLNLSVPTSSQLRTRCTAIRQYDQRALPNITRRPQPRGTFAYWHTCHVRPVVGTCRPCPGKETLLRRAKRRENKMFLL